MGFMDTLYDWLATTSPFPGKPTTPAAQQQVKVPANRMTGPVGPDPQQEAIRQAALRKQLDALRPPAAIEQPQQLPQQPPQNTVLTEIMKQLMANSKPTVANIPAPPEYTYDQLYDKYHDMISSQYDPQQQLLQRQIDERRARYDQSAVDVQGLYSSAQGAFGGDGPNNFSQMRADEQNRLTEYDNYTDNVYADASANMAQEFGTLGIDSVNDYSAPKQAEDLGYLQTQNKNSSDAFMRYLDASATGEGNYQGAMSSSYGLAGAEQGEQLQYDKNQFLDDSDQQMLDLESQEQAALNAFIMQKLSGQDDAKYNWQVNNANNQQSSNDAIFQRLLSLGGFQMQMDAAAPKPPDPMDALNQQMKQLQIQQLQQKINDPTGGKGSDYSTGMLGAAQRIQEVAPQNAQMLTEALQKLLLGKQQFLEDRYKTAGGDVVDMNPQQAAHYAQEYAQAAGLSPQDTNALIQGMLAYFGKMQ